MKAILIKKPGGPEELILSDYEKPNYGKNDLLVKVRSAALNRADLLQRMGKYPPPEGASPILGMDIAGDIIKIGNEVSDWKTGDKVFGLIPGGGYAEYAAIHKNMAMRIPSNITYEQASAIPEVFLTSYQTLIWLGDLKKGNTVLIHAGASGVGTAAIQIVKEKGGHPIITASKTKHKKCMELGAEMAIDYKTEKFSKRVLEYTNNKGADLIIDFIGGSYFNQNIECLSEGGKMIFLAAMGGGKVESFNLGTLLYKHISIIGSTLRSRTLDYKINLTKDFYSYAKDKFESGELKPVIDRVFTWEDVKSAHQYMEENKNIGKIVLTIS